MKTLIIILKTHYLITNIVLCVNLNLSVQETNGCISVNFSGEQKLSL